MNASMQSKYAFNIVPITTKDYNAVIEFLLKFFIRDEPLNMAAELIKEKDAGRLKNYLKRIFHYDNKSNRTLHIEDIYTPCK